MKKTKQLATAALVLLTASPALAANVTNKDSEPRALVVTENGVQSEIVLGAGETRSFCADGCFITLPNGDRAALMGNETLDIVGGDAVIN